MRLEKTVKSPNSQSQAALTSCRLSSSSWQRVLYSKRAWRGLIFLQHY